MPSWSSSDRWCRSPWKNAVFVRPTRAEGDAVSVREAQRAGIPVIASDIVDRPHGVVSFSSENVRELCAALRAVLDGAIEAVEARRNS